MIANVDEIYERELRPGQRIAMAVAETIGSWRFIIGQSLFFAAWIVLNVVGWVRHWDPYPFIFLNLVLNIEAAYTVPLVMMAQNRDAERDRLMMRQDYETNRATAEEMHHGRLLVRLLEQERARERART